MTVSELIELLRQQPQDLLVAYRCCSEQCLLEADDLRVFEACKPRADGWIQNRRADQEKQSYLMFPGN